MRSGRQWMCIGIAVAALGAIAATGCSRSDGTADPVVDPTGLAAADDATAQGPLAALTVQEIDARAHLTEAQKADLTAALGRLRASQRPRWSRGDGSGTPAGEPPAIAFFEDASKALDPDQFKELALLVKEKRDASMQGKGAMTGANGPRRGTWGAKGNGPTGNGPMMAGFLAPKAVAALGLTTDQQAALRPIFQDAAAQSKAVWVAVRSGATAREEAQAKLRDIRSSTRDRAKAILTPEQWAKVGAFRHERIEKAVDERLATLNDNLTRRADFLGRVLGLTADQNAQVRSLVLGTIPARTQILDGLKAGTVEPEDAAGKIATIEETLEGQIAGVLAPDQKERWDALAGLFPFRMRA